MRAVRLHDYGGPLQVEDVSRPEPADDELLVRVGYAAVNPLDIWIAAGRVAAAGPLPRTPGGEGVGTTTDGRRVAFRGAGLGLTRDGTYAEEVAVPRAALVELPDGVAEEQAAGLAIAGGTALGCLDLGRVEQGTTVLVLGASGGVGSLALRLARARGARTIAQSSSPHRAAGLQEIADDVLVGGPDELGAGVRALAPDGVDVVLDGLADRFTAAAVRCLAPQGRIVLYGASAGPELTIEATALYRNGGSILGFGGTVQSPEEQIEALRRLLDEIAAGRLDLPPAAVLPLEQAAEAHRRILANEAGGKLLLRP